MSREIPLTKGMVAIVDDEDFDSLNQFKWYAKNNKAKNRPTDIFYACRRDKKFRGKRKTIYMHRFLMNPPRSRVVDHRNGNPLDNRKENLRVCTRAENNQNLRHHRENAGCAPYEF